MRNLLRCRRGAVGFATLIAMVPLIGAVALGGEAATWYVIRQQAQNAADAAAYSGALTLSCTLGACSDAQTVDYRGKEFAAQNGFCNSGDTGYPGNACLPTRPPQSVTITQTTWNGKPAVQATVQQTQPTYLAGVLGLTTVQIGATAVAQVFAITTITQQPPSCASNCGCILQTKSNPAGGTGLSMSNGVSVTLNNCGVKVNATDKTKALSVTGGALLTVTGGALLTSPSLSVNGGVAINNGGKIKIDKDAAKTSCPTPCPYSTGKNVGDDPYAAAGVVMPTSSGGPTTNWTCGGGATCNVSPGVSTSVALGNGSTFNMQPGIYFINNGITIGGGVTVKCPLCTAGAGVTFVINSGTVNIGNGASVTLTAPSTGPTAGIAFFGSTSASEINVNNFAGGVIMKITGVLYFPTQTLSFSNGVTTNNGAPCTQLIAASISMVGGATLNSTQCPQGMLEIGATEKSTTTSSIVLVK
ncbi:TadG family pilus assembly protein [uncultured Rhodoblastus sp.]|uniref:TadG family pilus assembly protein n=1 Tax=uncultured Rhodoblastus sp. TaxID=543037 RepID=UPI0025D01FCF|nr:TadG family pilus assembly protein [uncultured Rhodoblastus sp.]